MRGEVTGRPTGLRQASAYGISAGSKGQITTDKPDLNTMNTPEAQDARAVQALRMSGKPMEAMQMQAGSMGLKKTQADLDAAAKDRIAKDATMEIMGATTPEHFANMVTKQEGFGLTGINAKVIQSPDGKTWGLSVTTPDGTEKQLPFQFGNDAAGVRQAQLAFIGRVNPELKLKLMEMDDKKQNDFFNQGAKTTELRQTEKRDASTAALNNAHIGHYSAQNTTEAARAKLLGAQADNAALPDAASSKMPEEQRQAIAEIVLQRRHLNDSIIKTQSDMMYDPKVVNHGIKNAQGQIAALNLKENEIRRKFESRLASGGSTSDPQRLREKTVAAQNEPPYDERQTPQRRAEQDAIAAQRELDREKDPKVRAILQAEVDKARRLASQPPPSAAAGLAQARSAEPIATPQKKEMSPVDTAGEKVDTARSKLQVLKNTKPPGLNAGISAREQYALAIENAKKEVDSALEEYQKILPKQIGAPFKLPQDLAKR
jgi:hypothetical protein